MAADAFFLQQVFYRRPPSSAGLLPGSLPGRWHPNPTSRDRGRRCVLAAVDERHRRPCCCPIFRASQLRSGPVTERLPSLGLRLNQTAPASSLPSGSSRADLAPGINPVIPGVPLTLLAVPLRCHPHGAERRAFAGADDDQAGGVGLSRVVASVQVGLGGCDVVDQVGVILAGVVVKIFVADRRRRLRSVRAADIADCCIRCVQNDGLTLVLLPKPRKSNLRTE